MNKVQSAEQERAHTLDGDVVDRRIMALIADYARLTGAHVESPAPNLLRLTLTPGEAVAFGGRAEHLLALDLAAIEQFPDAELPVIGGNFWTSLVDAIRRHGQRRVTGTLPITVNTTAETPDVAVADASVELKGRTREMRRIVRLTAKVTIAAGTTIHEEVIESDAIDLTTGQPLPPSVAAVLIDPEAADVPQNVPPAPASHADRLVPTLIDGLEEKVATREGELRAQSERDLRAELSRIDRYYDTLRQEVRSESGDGSAVLRTIEHEHEKRRTEEIRRHNVRIDVQPLQVLERTAIVEKVSWQLESKSGRSAELNAQRYLSGDGSWGIHCTVCRVHPERLTVCRAGHAIGAECTSSCSVCNERFCSEHGHSACVVDGQPVCREHASECWSCDRIHCDTHTARCEDGDHSACTGCIGVCGSCSRSVCWKHATPTHDGSPYGARLLCRGCIVYCEGSTAEPIGRDEAAPCGTCGKHICERHQVRCVVDGQPHCSKHLRRSDRSRRFICESHIAACGHESSEVLFVSDEVRACVECGKSGCDRHAAPCHEDSRWHCWEHLASINDIPNAAACALHRSACHVDGRVFSLKGTAPCEICALSTCRTHIAQCGWCGGSVCVKDVRDNRCITCGQLSATLDPPDVVVSAATKAAGSVRPKSWLIARDGGRFVVQLDLGWMRKLVITVPHGADTAERIVRHSLFGTKGL